MIKIMIISTLTFDFTGPVVGKVRIGNAAAESNVSDLKSWVIPKSESFSSIFSGTV